MSNLLGPQDILVKVMEAGIYYMPYNALSTVYIKTLNTHNKVRSVGIITILLCQVRKLRQREVNLTKFKFI